MNFTSEHCPLTEPVSNRSSLCAPLANMLRVFGRPSTLSRHLPAAFQHRCIAAQHPPLTAPFSGIEGQSHCDPLIPHPLPSPHTPPSFQPPSTAPREEYEKRKQRTEEWNRAEAVQHELARETEVMVDVTDATAEEGKREVDDKVAAALELLSMNQAEQERLARLQNEAASKRSAHRQAEQAIQEEQKRRQQTEKEKKDARERQQRAVEAQQRAEQLAEEDKKAAAARAEQARVEEQRRAERRQQQQLQQQRVQQPLVNATQQSSKSSSRGQQDDQLRAKQEKERADRARWLAAQPVKSSAASTAPPTTQQQSTSTRTEEMKRKEESLIREARTREQQAEEKQRAVVKEERERAARHAQQQQAQQQQAAAQAVKESWDRQKAQAQAAAAEEERKQKAAIVQQEEAERKRQEELHAAAQAKQRKLDAANREEAERLATAQRAEKKKVDEAMQKEQRRQQADLIAALQKDHLRSPAEFSAKSPSIARAAVVLTPGAPPTNGGGGGSATVVATPGPEVVLRTERPEEKQQREDRQGAWLTYALIGAGGGLVVLYSLMRKREREEGARIITTEYILPAPVVQQLEARESLASLPQTQTTATVMDTLPPSLVSHPIPPPLLPPLPAPLPLPTVDESAFPDLSTSLPVSTSAPLSSVETELSLTALLNSLQSIQLQDLLATLTKLETDEAHYLRRHVQSALTRQLDQLRTQVAGLSSGVTVSVDAPLLSHGHSGDADKSTMSVEELQRYLASLQRQHDTLTHGGSALSANASRAMQEVERQMEAMFAPLLIEQRQQAEQLVTQILSIERSLTQSALARQSELAINDSVARAIEEERERWLDVERIELRTQRDDLLALSRLYLLRQRTEMDRMHDAVRQRRMGEWRQVSVRMRGLLDAFSRLVRDTAMSERLHAVALAALTLESIEREEDLEEEEDRGRVRTEGSSTSRPAVTPAERAEEWRRLWRLRSEDEVIDAAVSALPSHVLESGVESSKELKRQWRHVQSAMKEEAFVPKSANEAEQGRSVWAQLVGRFFSLLYLSPSTAAAATSGGADEVEVLDRMNASVVNRRWHEALRLQQQLGANNRQLSQRWRQAVEDRVLVEQTLSTVRARIICLSLAQY